jgi:hypothetical protein
MKIVLHAPGAMAVSQLQKAPHITLARLMRSQDGRKRYKPGCLFPRRCCCLAFFLSSQRREEL